MLTRVKYPLGDLMRTRLMVRSQPVRSQYPSHRTPGDRLKRRYCSTLSNPPRDIGEARLLAVHQNTDAINA